MTWQRPASGLPPVNHLLPYGCSNAVRITLLSCQAQSEQKMEEYPSSAHAAVHMQQCTCSSAHAAGHMQQDIGMQQHSRWSTGAKPNSLLPSAPWQARSLLSSSTPVHETTIGVPFTASPLPRYVMLTALLAVGWSNTRPVVLLHTAPGSAGDVLQELLPAATVVSRAKEPVSLFLSRNISPGASELAPATVANATNCSASVLPLPGATYAAPVALSVRMVRLLRVPIAIGRPAGISTGGGGGWGGGLGGGLGGGERGGRGGLGGFGGLGAGGGLGGRGLGGGRGGLGRDGGAFGGGLAGLVAGMGGGGLGGGEGGGLRRGGGARLERIGGGGGGS